MAEIRCERIWGGSVKVCGCRLPIGADGKGGWLECPPEARGLLEPVPVAPKPAPRSDGIAEPTGFDRRRYAMAEPITRGATLSVANVPPIRLSGDVCEFCGSPNLHWSGTCKVCHDCGSPAGGCS